MDRIGGIVGVMIGLLVLAGGLSQMGTAQGQSVGPSGPTGMGWCTFCGCDRPLSHDFTHGRTRRRDVDDRRTTGDDGGVARPTRPATPDPGVTNYNKGIDLYRQKNWSQAERYFKSSLSHLPFWDSDPWRMIGKCRQHMKDGLGAIAAYRKALRRNLFDFDGRRELRRLESWKANCDGADLARKGKWRGGLAKFKRAKRLDRENKYAADNLKVAKKEVERLDAAEAVRAIYSSAVVDLRDKGPSPMINPADLKQWSARRPHRSLTAALDDLDRARGRRIRHLSDKVLGDRIGKTRDLLKTMGKTFAGKEGQLKLWLKESQEAEKNAIKLGLDELKGMLTAGLLKKVGKVDPAFEKQGQKLAEALDDLTQDLAKAGVSYARSTRDREAKLRAAKDVLQGAYAYLSKAGDKITDSGPEAVKLAAFLVDYSYEASRWCLARQQIGAIIDGMDRSGGELDAQKAVIKLHEDLIQERNRRKTDGAASLTAGGAGV